MKKSNTDVLAAFSRVSDIQVMGERSWKNRLACGMGALALSCLFWVGPAQGAPSSVSVDPNPLSFSALQADFEKETETASPLFAVQSEEKRLISDINPLNQVKFLSDYYLDLSTHDDHSQSLPINTLTAEEAQLQAPFVELGVLDSFTNESKDDFLMRVARSLDDFTTKTKHEACGAIMSTPDQSKWRVRLITNRSHVGCVRAIFSEPGFLATNETIHSHPQHSSWQSIFANKADNRLRGFSCQQKIVLDDKTFSPGDLTNGPGYLVARGRLLYQSNGEVKVIGSVDKKAKKQMLVATTTHRPGIVENSIHETKVLTVPQNADEKVPINCRARGY